MKIQQVQLELSSLKREKNYYEKNYYGLKNEKQNREIDHKAEKIIELIEKIIELDLQPEELDELDCHDLGTNKGNEDLKVEPIYQLIEELTELGVQPDELDELIEEIIELGVQPDELDEPIEELTELGVQPEELDSHDVVPTSGSWRHGCKRLLKIGLGVAAVGLIIPAAYWGFSMLNSYCLFNCVCDLLEPCCHLGNGLVPF